MKKTTLWIFWVLLSVPFLLGVTRLDACWESLTQLFSQSIERPKIESFLRLQGKLTLHKVTYALFQNERSKERLNVEAKIDDLLEQIDTQNRQDPEFEKALNDFEKNPLSRSSLAKILPFVQNILAEQMQIQDPYDRKNYILHDSDFKLLAIVAEGAEGAAEGEKQGNSKLINFTKLIDSSLKNKKASLSLKKRWKKEISDLEYQLDQLLKTLPLSAECKNQIAESCATDNPSEILKTTLLEASSQLLNFKNANPLEYGSFWLHVNFEANTSLKKPPPSKSLGADKVFVYLKKKVLNRYAYFFHDTWLDKNPEIVFQLSRAIDRDETKISYQGRTFRIPEIINRDHYIKRSTLSEISLDEYEKMHSSTHCIRHSREATNLMKAIQGLEIYNKKNGTNIPSFSYQNHLCDGKTGKKLTSTPDGFFSYPLGGSDSKDTNFYGEHLHHPQDRKKIILEALNRGEDTYIYQGNLYHLSGATPKSSIRITSPIPEIQKATLENRNFAIVQGRLLNTKTGEPIPKELMQIRIKQHLATITSSEAMFDFENLDRDFLRNWLEAIDAKRNSFRFMEQEFSTHSGKNLREKKSVKISNAEYLSDSYFTQTLDQINSLEDRDLIIEHQKLFGPYKNPCNYFTLVDKKNSTLEVLSNQGKTLFHEEILLGRSRGDSTSEKAAYTSAGIFYSQHVTRGKPISLQSELPSRNSPLKIESIPLGYETRLSAFNNGNLKDNRTTEGSIELPPKKFKAYTQNFSKSGCPIYILPEDDLSRFRTTGGALILTIKNQNQPNPANILYSPATPGSSFPIKISYDEKIILKHHLPQHSPAYKKAKKNLRKFADSLEQSKVELMQQLKLSNTEYNALAKVAIGILKVESKFGTSVKYSLKETPAVGQWLVDFLQITLRDHNTSNSRGLTQIKDINRFLSLNGYSKINEEALKKPEVAAKATLIVLADMLRTLKKQSHSKEFIDFSNHAAETESIEKYIYYLYQGKKNQIERGIATPDLNPKVTAIRDVTRNIQIFTRF